MSFPTLLENMGKITAEDLTGWVHSEADGIKNKLTSSGAVLFRGFPVDSAEDFDAFATAFGYGSFTYEESLSNAVRINLTPRVFTANEAPPDVEIFLHHEMAQTPVYPDKIFFCCLSSADNGGATPLCRSDQLFTAYRDKHPGWANAFRELGLKYTTHMPAADDTRSGQGRSWLSTLGANGKEAAEEKLAELGYTWQWLDDDSLLATTPALPAVRGLPDGTESFFNQVIAVHRGWEHRENNDSPLLTFGNGEPIPEEALAALIELAADYTTPVDWQDRDIALVDNHRVMHGRYPYSGERKRRVVVCLAKDLTHPHRHTS